MGVSASHEWLHMDVVEKEKMEWMTDVPLHPQSSEVRKPETYPTYLLGSSYPH